MEVDDHFIIEALKAFPDIANMTHYTSPLEESELLGAAFPCPLECLLVYNQFSDDRNILQGRLPRGELF